MNKEKKRDNFVKQHPVKKHETNKNLEVAVEQSDDALEAVAGGRNFLSDFHLRRERQKRGWRW